MRSRFAFMVIAAGSLALLGTEKASGQHIGFSNQQASTQYMTNTTRRALKFYGVGDISSLSQIPVRRVAAPQAKLPPLKPFSQEYSQPTLSPYLNMFREEQTEGLPNYHAMVRPQLQRRQIFQNQNMKLNDLNRQIQATEVRTTNALGGSRVSGYKTRYNNLGSYYGRR